MTTTKGLATRPIKPGPLQGVNVQSRFTPMGTHGSESSTDTVVTLTPPPGADKIILQTNTQNIRYTISEDGVTNPTTSSGFVMEAGAVPVMIVIDPKLVLKVIAETSGAIVEYQWGI